MDEFVLNQINEIPKTFGHYRIIRVIGSGSFSIISLVENRQSHQTFACKIVSRKMLQEQNIFPMFEREVRTMQTVNHPNIVSLVDAVFFEEWIFLVLEYCKMGDLHRYVCDHGPLPEKLCRKLFRQIVEALIYIHQKNIAHRDLKPENILLCEGGIVKLSDFGLCHPTKDNLLLKTSCGSPFYAAPEVVMHQPYDGKLSDTWSLGIILYMMASGCLPWTSENEAVMRKQICRAEFTVPNTVSPFLRSLICDIIKVDPKKRLLLREILEHPWFSEEEEEDDVENSDENMGKDHITANNSEIEGYIMKIPNPSTRKKVKSELILAKPIILQPQVPQKRSVRRTPLNVLIRRIPPNSCSRAHHNM